MQRHWLVVLALAVVLAVPFLLRRHEEVVSNPDEVLVVITPHVEGIRHEFELAFRDHYKALTGKVVEIDWRVIGGTSEITRYLQSEYLNAFRFHWEKRLGRAWSQDVQDAYANPRVVPDDTPEDDDAATAARRAFLASDIGIGLDVFFGGGSFDFIQQADAGRLVPSGLRVRHPEWFRPSASAPGPGIPRSYGGELFWDEGDRWYGTVVSAFGIVANRDSLARLGVEQEPQHWSDLTDPRFFGQVAAADPSKSGTMNKIFELIVQEQMQRLHARYVRGGLSPEEAERKAVEEGWAAGMMIIQQVAGNARYFTDSAPKPSLDVAAGDCAVGISIDFYGRFQEENLTNRGGKPRFLYRTPEGGSSASVDPIGILRGAPSRALAEAFVDYVMSHEGQKLWNFEPGTPGGPRQYALRRPPVRPDLYAEEFRAFRSDPDVDPYADAAGFEYRPEWTGRLFGQIRFIIKTCFIDLHPEVKRAWKALIDAGFPPEATALFHDLSRIDYAAASGTIRDANRSKNRLDEVRLARELAMEFRARYERVIALAEAGR